MSKPYFEMYTLVGFEDPYCLIRDFVTKWGNPIYLYQGGQDDDIFIVSTYPMDEIEQAEAFQEA